MKIHFRKIRLRILFGQGFSYRLFIVCCNTAFFLILFGSIEGAFKLSITWNVINVCLYFIFHYIWARVFKLGKNNGGGIEWHVQQQQRSRPSLRTR